MSTAPIFTATPVISSAQISTANTNRDGTGTLADIATGATNGTRIDRITVIATGTTSAGMVRLYIYDGTNNRLWKEVPITAIAPTAAISAFASVLPAQALILPNGYKLRASTHNAETFNVIAEGGSY
ncbi:hypothetical protein CCAX7_000310 [Capsulimonas corticalis]|uniref:Uncharacterized protein n=1 Tax=Capsulimonas corticalis TaxID=2219043 RepID=A0A402CRE6_9BACT|nr:hypothetical protein [Capsulimonas corticalis]BDI27980.1 hypothetical protein CCAX7_000310 [Capsulimonas corticalis]